MRRKNIFLVIFLLLIGYLSWESLINSFNEIYFLKIKPIRSVKGVVLNVNRNNSIGGALSYEYNTQYYIDKNKIERKFLTSPDSLKIGVGDSIIILYSLIRPSIAKIQIQPYNWNGFIFSVTACIIIIFFFISILFEFTKK